MMTPGPGFGAGYVLYSHHKGSRYLPGGSWDLVSTVMSTLIGVRSKCKYSYLIYNPSY